MQSLEVQQQQLDSTTGSVPTSVMPPLTVSREVQTVMPKCVVVREIPGMIFGEEDLPEFQRYVGAMDATEGPNRN
jgi:hypothetical protein